MSEGEPPMGREARMEREMTDLAPLVRRRRQAEAQSVNPEYAATLRARLMAMPTPDDLAELATARPIAMQKGESNRVRTRLAVFAIAVAAVLVAILLTHRPFVPRHPVAIATPVPTIAPIVAMAAPTPSAHDLLRAYPAGAGGGGVTSPEQSLFDIPGVSYAGHLRIVGPVPSSQPRVAHAFRLVSPSSIAGRMSHLRRQLGIHDVLAQAPNPLDHTPWVSASDGGLPSSMPLHSIAVSLQTGELIYHDAPGQPRQARPLNASRAVMFARRWLIGLGWPGATMPVQSTTPRSQMFPPSIGTPWEVSLGWARTGSDGVAAATVLVMPDGRVFEARVWPPVAHRGAVRTRDVAGTWKDVREGRVQVAVEGMADRQPVNGVATLQRVDVVQILVTAPQRGPYLVPAYRFVGIVRLQGSAGTKTWYGLASAVRSTSK